MQQITDNRIIVSPGEPAGIGPDLVIQLGQKSWPIELVVCADAALLQERAKILSLPIELIPYDNKRHPIPQRAGTLTILPIPLRAPVYPGRICIKNAYYVMETLERACSGCLKGEFSALVTGPVHKEIMNKAGILFKGHTEFFSQYSRVKRTVMMLVTEKMRVALATTHLPIKDISNAITKELLYESITILHDSLCSKFNIIDPCIMVCGLNPHAGEGGYIGTEEKDIIIPVLEKMRKKSINLVGPLSADSIFQEKYLNDADVILTMYHDQGLPVLKYQGFGQGVNITLGLPFIRTSVDHGTALNLSGKGEANINSFQAALNLAIKIINFTL